MPMVFEISATTSSELVLLDSDFWLEFGPARFIFEQMLNKNKDSDLRLLLCRTNVLYNPWPPRK